jgi:hypothetical protein
MSFQLMHAGAIRPVDLAPLPHLPTPRERTRAILRFVTYLVFFAAGAALLWRRPSALAWTFFLYCASRRFAELGVYWPGSDDFFWANLLLLATLGGANCAFAASFALRLRRESGRLALDAVSLTVGALLAVGWFCVIWLVAFAGRPSQDLAGALCWLTAAVYLGGAALAVAALISRDQRTAARLPLLWATPIAFIAQAAAVEIRHRIEPFNLFCLVPSYQPCRRPWTLKASPPGRLKILNWSLPRPFRSMSIPQNRSIKS